MQIHHMHLFADSFKQIKNETKTIELRLNDNKRKNIKSGDIIIFKEIKKGASILTIVENVLKFKSFKELYKNVNLLECGYSEKELKKANHKDMLKYYHISLVREYGAIAIKVKLLKVKNLNIDLKSIQHLTGKEVYIELQEVTPEIPSKGYFKAYKYNIHLKENDLLIGYMDLRLGYNENVFYGGQIGYFINQEYRGNSYAKKAAKLLLEVAKKHQLEPLFISSDPNNIPSRRTIENLGFKLIGIFNLPPDNEMYLLGDRKKAIYIKNVL